MLSSFLSRELQADVQLQCFYEAPGQKLACI